LEKMKMSDSAMPQSLAVVRVIDSNSGDVMIKRALETS
jgi:hypothetical protein